MAKGKTTTVTHPDGTVSKRTSESRTYTHAVVISRTRESLVADEMSNAAAADERARIAAAAVGGEVTEESRSWSGGLRYITLFLGGEYAGAHVSDKPRPSDEELREGMRKRVKESEARAQEYRDKAAKLGRGPAMQYGVLRWSSRADLAHSAVSGEFGRLVRPGVTVEAVTVD
jgi:hypothetical protein